MLLGGRHHQISADAAARATRRTDVGASRRPPCWSDLGARSEPARSILVELSKSSSGNHGYAIAADGVDVAGSLLLSGAFLAAVTGPDGRVQSRRRVRRSTPDGRDNGTAVRALRRPNLRRPEPALEAVFADLHATSAEEHRPSRRPTLSGL